MKKIFRRSAVGAAAASLCIASLAQTTGTLNEVTVTGNPLGAAERVAPAEKLGGTQLLLRSQGSLGET
ncbi:MAG TPA: hypothetical protein VLJ58_16765, partial [Ramlibacter sp.]|nr:hypothetical protein [Ramlibacter sp.]